LSAGKIGQRPGLEHHLFLVDGDAVGILEIGLHHGMVVNHHLATMFPVDVRGNILHRARPVEGIHGNKILETVRLKQLQPFFHSGRFELENGCRLRCAEELEGFGIVHGQVVNVDLHLPGKFDIFETLLDDGEGF